MNISKGAIANLCFIWTIALLLGLTIGLNVPFFLMVLGTILYLV